MNNGNPQTYALPGVLPYKQKYTELYKFRDRLKSFPVSEKQVGFYSKPLYQNRPFRKYPLHERDHLNKLHAGLAKAFKLDR